MDQADGFTNAYGNTHDLANQVCQPRCAGLNCTRQTCTRRPVMASAESVGESSRFSSRASNIRFLYLGAITPMLFWITTVVCGFVLGDYNHFSRMVSELGTIGAPSQLLFTFGLVSCSILSVLFVFGLRRTCQHLKLSTVPAWLILSYSLSIAGAGLFPLPLRLHGILGMPSILLVLSPFTALLLWNNKNSPSNLKVMAWGSLVVMSLGFLAFSPAILRSSLGLKQRFFHLGWSIWFMYLCIAFTQAMKDRQGAPGSPSA
jgi:hypothetical membrane protein